MGVHERPALGTEDLSANPKGKAVSSRASHSTAHSEQGTVRRCPDRNDGLCPKSLMNRRHPRQPPGDGCLSRTAPVEALISVTYFLSPLKKKNKTCGFYQLPAPAPPHLPPNRTARATWWRVLFAETVESLAPGQRASLEPQVVCGGCG